MIRFAFALIAVFGLFAATVADACPLQLQQQGACYSQQVSAAYYAPPVQQVVYQPPQQIVAAPVQAYYAPAPLQQQIVQPVYGQQLKLRQQKRLNVAVGAYAAPVQAVAVAKVRGPLFPRLPRNQQKVVVPAQVVQPLRY